MTREGLSQNNIFTCVAKRATIRSLLKLVVAEWLRANNYDDDDDKRRRDDVSRKKKIFEETFRVTTHTHMDTHTHTIVDLRGAQ